MKAQTKEQYFQEQKKLHKTDKQKYFQMLWIFLTFPIVFIWNTIENILNKVFKITMVTAKITITILIIILIITIIF